jgi:hypothetical protein
MELAKGDVKEVFRHLKGWYRKVAEVQARPCQQTMEHQTDKQEELYVEQAAYGKAFPANGMPYTIGDNQPIESKLQAAASLLSHGQCEVLWGYKQSILRRGLGEPRKKKTWRATSHVGAGKMWHKFVRL